MGFFFLASEVLGVTLDFCIIQENTNYSKTKKRDLVTQLLQFGLPGNDSLGQGFGCMWGFGGMLFRKSL